MADERCDRHNAGKNRLGLISPIIPWVLGEVYTQGATKYDANNWAKGCPYSELLDCVYRHLLKWQAGHQNDEESGLHHLSHCLWNIGTLLHMEKLSGEYAQFDDRLKICADAIPNSSAEKP